MSTTFTFAGNTPRLEAMYVIGSVLTLVLMIAALVDIITRGDGQIKHLPKVFWIILVIIIPLVGSILWFAVGREYSQPVNLGSFGDPRRREATLTQQREAPRRRTTEEELADLEREIEFHDQKARMLRLEQELEKRPERPDSGATSHE